MDGLIYLFVSAVLVVAALASLAIWAPRRTAVRVAALLMATLFMPLGYAQFAELLSKPKPRALEWLDRDARAAEILGVSLREGAAIYMWLRVEGTLEPRYYVFPWHMKLAERLEEVMEDAVLRNSQVVIQNPFTKRAGEDLGDFNLKVVPPAMPPMKKPRIPPRIFNPRRHQI